MTKQDPILIMTKWFLCFKSPFTQKWGFLLFTVCPLKCQTWTKLNQTRPNHIFVLSQLFIVENIYVYINIKLKKRKVSKNRWLAETYNANISSGDWVVFTFGVVLSPQRRAAAGAQSVSDPLLRPGQSLIEGRAVSQGQYKCLQLFNKDHKENRTGECPRSF